MARINQCVPSLQRWAFILPIITILSWFAMLGGLLGSWLTTGQPRYVSEEENQTVAFISDIGAQSLKPLFIVGASVAMISYIPSLIFYYYYLNPARQPLHTSQFEVVRWTHSLSSLNSSATLSSLPRSQRREYQRQQQQQHQQQFEQANGGTATRLSLFFQIGIPLLGTFLSLIGATNMILLTIFDTARYPATHRLLLPVSICSHILGCLVLCIWTTRSFREYRAQQARALSPRRSRVALTAEMGMGMGMGMRIGAGDVYIVDDDKFTVELHRPQIPISLPSLIVKGCVVVVEIVLVTLFALLTWWLNTIDEAAVIEWVVVLMFAAFVMCLVVDLWVLGTSRGDAGGGRGGGQFQRDMTMSISQDF